MPQVDKRGIDLKVWAHRTASSPRAHDTRHGRLRSFARAADYAELAALTEDTPIISEQIESNDLDHSDTIGGRIGRAREAAGLTVAQVARRLGVKTATWQGWENDRSEPRSNKLTMIAGTLGVSPAWLLTGFGEGPTEAVDDEIQLLRQEVRLIVQDVSSAQARLDAVLKRLETFHSFHHVEAN